MKLYKVIWEEKVSVTVEANSAKEAEDLVLNGEYDTAIERGELTAQPMAFEV